MKFKHLKHHTSNTPLILLVIVAILVIGTCIYLFNAIRSEAPINIDVTDNVKKEILGNKEDLVDFSVKPGSTVSGLLHLSGSVKNGYFFEANVEISLLDSNQNIMNQGYGTAKSEWMTSGPVSFVSTIDSSGLIGEGYIMIREDDPSGGEGGPVKKILIPVIFK